MEEYTTTVPHPKHGKRRNTSWAKPVLMVVGAVVIAAGAFFGGMAYQKHHGSSSANTNVAGRFGGFMGSGRRRSGGFGTVSAVSSTSITVQNSRTGTSTTYSINSSTQISDNGASADASAIQTGDTVLVQTSSSTSTTATRIDINPSFGGGFGGMSGTTTPSQSTNSSSGSQTGGGTVAVN